MSHEAMLLHPSLTPSEYRGPQEPTQITLGGVPVEGVGADLILRETQRAIRIGLGLCGRVERAEGIDYSPEAVVR